MVVRIKIVLVFLLAVSAVQAQKLRKDDKALIANLQTHIQILASDSLQGRRTGTPGEKMAMQYISNAFKQIGLEPKGTNGYYQLFEINEGKQINPATKLSINGHALKLYEGYFPFTYSPNTTLEASPAMSIQEMDMPWFLDIKELLQAHTNNPHFNLYDAIKAKAAEVKQKGATALFVYNSSDIEDGLQFEPRDASDPSTIPVIYITQSAAKKYLSDEQATLDIKLQTDIGPKKRTGSNVIGYIDNKAPTTVVIGAHFDHLGYGEDDNSLWRGPKEVHNGADDNASGTAALIELGRLLKASKLKNNNYLLIAFSGEELGLLGSKYFTQHPTIDAGSINYMINMDMIGRLNDSSHAVMVGGYGTSPQWGAAFGAKGKNKLDNGSLIFRFDSSGIGPSDHTSFYLKNIPVLFYYTGLHSDYHKPSDDFNKINYIGEWQVVKHIYSLIDFLNKTGNRLAFAKTRDAQDTNVPSFSVTLGVLPDYSYSGKGLRIDGVSDDRPAQKAGLKAGDVITALGSYPVNDIQTYMKALSNYKKGEKTIISFERGNESLQAAVQFF